MSADKELRKLTQKNERRQPAQERSRKRVDAILQAAKELINEKGSAQLKIHEIAERANVTPASIYQYFPSKNSISHALAERSFGQVQELIQSMVPQIESVDQAYDVLQGMVETLYQVYLDDPAIYDVWISMSADKISDMDLEDSRHTGDLAFNCLKPYYDEEHWEAMAQISFLLAHMAGAAVRMALVLGEAEGRKMVDSFKSLISPQCVSVMIESRQSGSGSGSGV